MSYAFIFYGFKVSREFFFCLYALPVNLALLIFQLCAFTLKKLPTAVCHQITIYSPFAPKSSSIRPQSCFSILHSTFCIFHSITLTDPPRLGSPPPAILGITV
jgi:hypothetical protein